MTPTVSQETQKSLPGDFCPAETQSAVPQPEPPVSFLLTFEDSRHRPPIPFCQMGWRDSCASPVNRAPLQWQVGGLGVTECVSSSHSCLGGLDLCLHLMLSEMDAAEHQFPTAVLSVSANTPDLPRGSGSTGWFCSARVIMPRLQMFRSSVCLNALCLLFTEV